MSYIIYLSLRWSHEVGSWTIAISVMTAIKWYLFCYRLDFNQKWLNYTVANTVSCALDIVNTMMSYILYLSLRWSYEVGSCNIVISVIRAIKWYLFSYRLHFNQISFDYTVVNAQSTVPNTVNCAEYTVNCNECTVNCALDIVNRMMSYILYLSLRWSYEVGSCTIAISAITAIKHYLFCYRLDFNQNSLNYTVANAQ